MIHALVGDDTAAKVTVSVSIGYTYVSTSSVDVTIVGTADDGELCPRSGHHNNGGQACQNGQDHVGYRLDRMNTNQRSTVKV